METSFPEKPEKVGFRMVGAVVGFAISDSYCVLFVYLFSQRLRLDLQSVSCEEAGWKATNDERE